MEDARTTRSRKAMEGCEDKVWPAWTKTVGAIPAKRFSLVYKDIDTQVLEAAAATIVGDPDGYLAGVALCACASPARDMLAKHIEHALLFWPGYRGPRNATQTQCKDDRSGKRLSRIESNGRLVYEGTCMKYGQVMVEYPAPGPIDTPSRYASALKVGMVLRFTEKWPLLATSSMTATAPSVVFGAPVK